jgi:hypothetical protein
MSYFTQDQWVRNFLFVCSAAGGVIILRGVITGRMSFRGNAVEREKDPFSYWFMVLGCAGVFAGMFYVALKWSSAP